LKHLVSLRKICEFHGVEVLYIDLISLKEYLALSYLHMYGIHKKSNYKLES
jgi:hypothetical protein